MRSTGIPADRRFSNRTDQKRNRCNIVAMQPGPDRVCRLNETKFNFSRDETGKAVKLRVQDIPLKIIQ